MWRDFLAFQVAAGLLPSQVTAQMLLSFMDFLHCNAVSSSQISNYLAALRSLYIVYGLNTSAFKDERLPLFIKSLQLQALLKPRSVLLLDIGLLQKLLTSVKNLAFQWSSDHFFGRFFSFVRFSNLLPHSVSTFDHTRQLARGDIIFARQGAVLVVTWSKTMQNRREFATIPLPDLQGSSLCPVTSLKSLLQVSPGDPNSPVFVIPRQKKWVPLTDSVARKHLKDVCKAFGLQKAFTFHDFRRAGASRAFQ